MSSRFPCMTLRMERFPLDFPCAVKNRQCALEAAEACFEPKAKPLCKKKDADFSGLLLSQRRNTIDVHWDLNISRV